MNQTVTMTAMGTTPQSMPLPAPAERPRSLLTRYLAALHANTTEAEHRNWLDLAVDHCDLEWRVCELDRRWSQSGLAVGGSRF